MEVVLEANARKPDQLVARLGNGVIGFFNRPPYGRVGDAIDVMIVSRGKEVRADGYPKVVFLVQVDPALDTLLHVSGFECRGSMCQTLAYAPTIGKTVLPGTVPLYVASNLNSHFYNLPYFPLIAHKVWCKAGGHMKVRAIGLDSLEDLDCYVRATNGRIKEVAAIHKQYLEIRSE